MSTRPQVKAAGFAAVLAGGSLGLPELLQAIPEEWGPLGAACAVAGWLVWSTMVQPLLQELRGLRQEVRGLREEASELGHTLVRAEERANDHETWIKELRRRTHDLANQINQVGLLQAITKLDT